MNNNIGNVWVFIDHEKGNIEKVSLELLGKGRELADFLGVKLEALLIGKSVKNVCDTLFAYGADRVLLAEDPRLDIFSVLPFAKVTMDLIRIYKPNILMFGATMKGRELAPRLASENRSGLTADCTELKIDDFYDKRKDKIFKNKLMQIRPAFGGNIIATIVNTWEDPQMVTVRPGVMKMLEPDFSRKGEIIPCEVSLTDADTIVKIIERVKQEKKVDLNAASIIVAGGYGVGSSENFKLLKELANEIGGQVAASRAAVDAGWISHDHLVGQTGVTVQPKLYIACGISGAIQHVAGMNKSKKIIAINKDPDAPIFSIAHYGIVGDLNTVIPMLIQSYKMKG